MPRTERVPMTDQTSAAPAETADTAKPVAMSTSSRGTKALGLLTLRSIIQEFCGDCSDAISFDLHTGAGAYGHPMLMAIAEREYPVLADAERIYGAWLYKILTRPDQTTDTGISAAATGVGGARGQTAGQRRRGGEQGQRLSPSVTVLGTQCSVSFQRSICRCSPHSRWGRTGEQIPSEHFTCPAVDKRRYRIRFRHPPAMQPGFGRVGLDIFPEGCGYEKGTPKGPLRRRVI